MVFHSQSFNFLYSETILKHYTCYISFATVLQMRQLWRENRISHPRKEEEEDVSFCRCSCIGLSTLSDTMSCMLFNLKCFFITIMSGYKTIYAVRMGFLHKNVNGWA